MSKITQMIQAFCMRRLKYVCEGRLKRVYVCMIGPYKEGNHGDGADDGEVGDGFVMRQKNNC